MIPPLKIVIKPIGLPSKRTEEWNNGIFSLNEHEWCGLTCKPPSDINGEGTCCLKFFFASFFILYYISSNQPLVTCTPILLQLSPVSQVASTGEAFGLYYLMIGSDYSIYSRMPVFFFRLRSFCFVHFPLHFGWPLWSDNYCIYSGIYSMDFKSTCVFPPVLGCRQHVI